MHLRSFFAALHDPRLPRTRRYPLVDIVLIVLVGLLSGADNFVEIVRWANFKHDWLKEHLGIERIPSHDTLGRVLAKLDPRQLSAALEQLAQRLSAVLPAPTEPRVIALDGKELRGALGRLNLVSAWASHAQLTLAVQRVPDGTNEIPIVQEVIGRLEVKASVVTADALHCQKETAAVIVARGGDYLLCLKRNQGGLWQQAQDYFERLVPEMEIALKQARTLDKAHGQWIETRLCRLTHDVGWFDPEQAWPGLRSMAQIIYERRRGSEVVRYTRYFVTSLSRARAVLGCSRGHWGIENSQHWRLDVFYREDDSRVRVGNAATNLAIMRRLSLSILQRDKHDTTGVQTRRKSAGWDDAYRERLLSTAKIL
jgi:predicted transposase YbfD/YdcC